jgi:hypothetical protein
MKKKRADLKILLISGYAGANVFHQVVDPEMRFLGKPFSRIQLASKVRELLDQPAAISDGKM